MVVNASVEPLPGHAYVPGQNKRHAENFLNHVKSAAPAETRDSTSADNQAWLYGLRLIRHRFFWEAHEILETVWMRAAPNSRERHLVQGVIHVANAALKQEMGRPEAAQRLYNLAAECVREAFSGQAVTSLMGMKRESLLLIISDQTTSDISPCF